jgi:mycothiol synthase
LPVNKMPTDFIIRLYQEADFSQVLEIVRAASRADGEAYLPTEAELRARFATPHPDPRLDPAQDMFVAESPGAGLLAYADGVLRGERQSPIYQTWCFVPPKNRRRGIGRALLERQWARAKEVSAQLESDTIRLRARIFDTQMEARALFAEAAMQCVRYFFEMRRDLSPEALRALPIPRFDLPPDLKLESWAEQRQDHAVWEATNEAFLDHWGSAPRRFESFEQQLTLGQFQPENSYLIWEGETLAGGTLNTMGPATAERLGRNQGWISQLFVRRPWRRRGLGRALLIASLLRAQTLGHESVGLNVDAENLTGALRLYESVGFYSTATLLIYERVYSEG